MFFRNNDLVIVVGSGRFGSSVANSLSLSGFDVTVIDKDEKSFLRLPPSFGGYEIIGDATDVDILLSAGINKAHMLVASTNSDNVNSLIAQIASRIFSVKKIFARFGENDKLELTDGFNVVPICPFSLSLNEFCLQTGLKNAEAGK